jgi:ABC-2 type transport system permease protein
MFFTIFFNEVKYWFGKPSFYIYTIIFLFIALLMSGASAGLFDFLTVTTGSSKIVNSPLGITGLFGGLSGLLIFLYPSIIGVSVYRDYQSEMHTILYSYPFTKLQYLLAKFFAGIFVVNTIVLIIALGIGTGFILPGTNQDIVGSFDLKSYLDIYLIYILPNMLFIGAIVFGIVTFTRNISAGFITVLIILILQGLLVSLFDDPEKRFFAAILDPFGDSAIQYYTRYWTVSEQNELHLPIKEVLIYNRLLWSGIGLLIFGTIYKVFSFSQNAFTFSFNNKESKRITKSNFGGIIKINLPKVSFDFSFTNQLKSLWKLCTVDFLFVVKSWPFICIVIVGLLINLIGLSELGNVFGTSTLPRTWRMLAAGNTFALAINICTFLYAGLLIHRSRIANINQLIDVSPTQNWVLFGSKFLAIFMMQLALSSLIIITGLIFQAYNGFYDFEISLYLYEVFALSLIYYVIWTFLTFLVQTLITSPYVGLFVMIVLLIGIPLMSLAGVEQSIFKYNQGPGYSYSDMNGYGETINRYFIYKIYWLSLGLVFCILTALFYVRGLPSNFNEKITIAKSRFKGKYPFFITFFTLIFISIGGYIYYENNVSNKRTTQKESEIITVEGEKKYKKYESYAQPRIVSVNVNVDIFPSSRDVIASGEYVMINKTSEEIDSIFLDHNSLISTFKFDKETDLVSEDTIYNFDIHKLKTPLFPGDSLKLLFTVKNKPNTILRNNSSVISNGTFINNSIFPSLGYSLGELSDDKTRKKYDLPPNKLKSHPSDSTALGNTYIAKDADWIDFEATVSTSKDQIAIAPGYLQKEWIEGDRRYFHYKMDSKILNFYAFNSAKYEVLKDKWNDVNLEIYYHKGHEYNLDRMIKGMKASLDYCSENFSPYQHKQLRIIEFPKTAGGFAQSFPNTIPFSESIGFIADVDDSEEGGNDYAFFVSVHEVAHQWWAHQVIGADVLGATVLSESLSEYVSLKVIEEINGKSKMRKFLKRSLDTYLTQRTFESKRENALMYNDGQGYIHYQKGSLIFYALSDYIGEKKLNKALGKYVNKVAFQEPPYTTSIDLVNHVKEVVPDSLSYIIKDMFETITLYQNRIVSTESKKLENGKYQVDIEFKVSKYRNDEKGKIFYGNEKRDSISYKNEKMKKPDYSVYLSDYIDVGIFGKDNEDKEVELYLKKHKISSIHNKISIITDNEPIEVGIDPYNKLIDTNSEDNRKKIKEEIL